MEQNGRSVAVTFTVNVATKAGQCVCLTGDDKTLGAWQPACMVELMRQCSGNDDGNTWATTVTLEAEKSYSYRYVVCKDPSSKGSQSKKHDVSFNGSGDSSTQQDKSHAVPVTVYKWETNVKPRSISLQNCEKDLLLPVANFGSYDGFTNIGSGWLINQSEIQIRLHSEPIYMWKPQHREQTYSVKCTAVDYSEQAAMQCAESDDSRDAPPLCNITDVYACNINDPNLSIPEPQGPTGIIYNHKDYIVFRSQVERLSVTGFQLDFYVCEPKRAPKFVGSSHLLPHKNNNSKFMCKVPIIGCNYRPIGEVAVECLVAKPVPGLNMKLDSSYQTYWKKRDPEKGLETSLDIGHRGMGASYSRASIQKENTVASFAAAFKHGADFVELDVLLSKDEVPVVYHDFSVKVLYSNKKDHSKETELYEIPVQNLTLSQLQSMRLFSGGHNVEINLKPEGHSSHQDPFPTLAEVLQSVDERLGFNVEIKYPQQLEDDTWELEGCIDLNLFLDHILKVVFACAASRKIVFSSFDPDTCILLKMKQNKYPVLFLNQGQTKIYDCYKDHRSSSFIWGINFALSEHLLGLALHAEVLLQDISILQQCYHHNMVVFVWGNDNNDPLIIKRMRELKVDGVIYDRIDHNKPEHQEPEFWMSSVSDAPQPQTEKL